MPLDTYTRVVLTVIAAALVVIALRGLGDPVPPAMAADMTCKFEGPLDIRSFGDDLTVELKQGYSEPGTSRSSPLYVKNVE